jgi:hypothetical protein
VTVEAPPVRSDKDSAEAIRVIAYVGRPAPVQPRARLHSRLGRRALACQPDRRIEEKVMARKKDKKAQSAQKS